VSDHIPFSGSDHYLTFATRKINKRHSPGRTIKYRPYATADIKSVKSELISTDFSHFKNNKIQSNSADFTNNILKLLDVHILLKQGQIKPSPPCWFTPEIAKLRHERDLLKKFAS